MALASTTSATSCAWRSTISAVRFLTCLRSLDVFPLDSYHIQIEHTILRAQTSSPNSIVGPFIHATGSLPSSLLPPRYLHNPLTERSPKAVFALKTPVYGFSLLPASLTLPSPLISFTLFFACYSSPPLTTLWEPSALNVELRRAACTYLLTHARVDRFPSVLFLLSLLVAPPELSSSRSSSSGTGETSERTSKLCWRRSCASRAKIAVSTKTS